MISNEFQAIAVQAAQLQREFAQHKITQDEYKELMENIGIIQAINNDTANLEENILYREMIISAINVLKTLA